MRGDARMVIDGSEKQRWRSVSVAMGYAVERRWGAEASETGIRCRHQHDCTGWTNSWTAHVFSRRQWRTFEHGVRACSWSWGTWPCAARCWSWVNLLGVYGAHRVLEWTGPHSMAVNGPMAEGGGLHVHVLCGGRFR